MFLERCDSMKTWVLCLVSFALLLGAADFGLAREKKTVQKSSTDAQARGGETWIGADLPTTNNGTADPLDIQARSGNEHSRERRKYFLLMPGIKRKRHAKFLLLHSNDVPANSPDVL